MWEYISPNLKINQEECFKKLFGEIDFDKKYKNPARKDNNPGCFFTYYDEELFFADFAHPKKSLWKCEELFSEINNISIQKAKELLLSEDISLKSSEKDVGKKIYLPKCKLKIDYFSRQYNKKDNFFWSKYGISIDNLIEDRVLPIIWYRVHTRKCKTFNIIPRHITYAYTYFVDFNNKRKRGKVKIYSPYDKPKFITNCKQDDLGFLEKLNFNNKRLIITKSYKDARVLLNNLNTNIIWTQSETQIPSKKILRKLSEFRKIIILFDNDEAGIKNANKFKKIFEQYTNLSPKLVFTQIEKDVSDLYKNNKREFYNFIDNVAREF